VRERVSRTGEEVVEMAQKVVVVGGAQILTPVRRQSDNVAYALRSEVVRPTVSALVVAAEMDGTAILAVEDAQRNHTWVQSSKYAGSLDWGTAISGIKNYVEGSHVSRSKKRVAPVVVILTNGRGKRVADPARNVRVLYDATAAKVLLAMLDEAEVVTVIVDGRDVTVSTG
jgi:hypothetical protein